MPPAAQPASGVQPAYGVPLQGSNLGAQPMPAEAAQMGYEYIVGLPPKWVGVGVWAYVGMGVEDAQT